MAMSVTMLFVLFLIGSTCAQNPSISITPNTDDITLFQGSEFRRVCAVEGVSGDVTVRLEWERDGQLIDYDEGNTQLQLHISEVDDVHEGEYMCRVILTPQSGSIINLGPMSGGTLTVLDDALIDAPESQVISDGSSGVLNCSYPGGLVTWRRQDNSVFDGRVSSASFADEGLYRCDIFEPISAASITVHVMLYVMVPVQIVSTSSPVHHNLTSNQPVTLAVDFIGRQSHDLTITWYHNSAQVPSSDSRIHNSFDSTEARGRTEFRLPLARRGDAGLYHVVISSTVNVVGHPPSRQETTFQIDVTVRPAVPANVHVDLVSATTARVSWDLTQNDQTPDEAADRLILRVTYSNRTLADLQQFSGDYTSMVLANLIPANDYSVVLTAENSDGEVTTNPVEFRTLEGAPHISSLQVERVNRTYFTVALNLAYTGGGVITAMSVAYRPTSDNMVATRLASMPPQSLGLSVRGVVMLTEQLQGQTVEEDAGMELQFIITVTNEFNFESEEVSVTVPAYVPAVMPTTAPSEPLPPPSSEIGGILPSWLIAVIASVVTILIMLVLVAVTVGVCVRCRHTNKPVKNNNMSVVPTAHQSVSDLSAAESGMLPTKSLESVSADQYRARSQSSSVPSESYTPSLEEHLEKKHRRELSEGSNIKIPMSITPSTTASNSPANFNKTMMINSSQDKGLDCINEQEVSHSDDSGTESERDRIRQQQMQSQHNMRNYQYVRGHADGSVCDSSHHSLVSSGSQYGMQGYPYSLNYSDPKHLYTVTPPGRKLRAENSGMYSDCESVVSSVTSVPSSTTLHQQRRSVQYRSPTPYNHDYHLTEESTV